VVERLMHTELRKRIGALDRIRRALLDEVEALAPEVVEAKPRPEKWSILEIVEHLVIAEREILGGLPDASQLSGKRRSVKNRVLYAVVMTVLRYPIPVKVPSRGMVPKGESSLAELRSQWDENHRWLTSCVTSLDEEGLCQAVFVHPVAGPMTVMQAVRMDQIHVERHTRQIGKILELRT